MKSVLISGAGIAGSALAFLLGRRGFRPTVVERDAGVRSSGTPVDVQGGAFDVAAEAGIVPRLREAATRAGRMAFVDRRGRRVASLDLSINGPRQIEVPRSSSAGILCDAARCEAELVFGDSTVDDRWDRHPQPGCRSVVRAARSENRESWRAAFCLIKAMQKHRPRNRSMREP